MSIRSGRALLLIAGLLLATLAAAVFLHPASITRAALVLVHNQPYTMTVTTPRRIPISGPTRLTIRVSKQGQSADLYAEHRVAHYILTSANNHDFLHTFSPEVGPPGEYYLDHTFTESGPYRLWVEIVDTASQEQHHGADADLLAYVDLTVAGPAQSARDLSHFVTGRIAPLGDIHVVLDHPPLRAEQPIAFNLHVEDAQGKTLPVFTEEPAIYVMIGPDFTFFRHTHTAPASPEHHSTFTETLPAAGQYLLWTEIYAQVGDTYHALQIPFLLTVPEN